MGMTTRANLIVWACFSALSLASSAQAEIDAKDICDETTGELSRERLAFQMLTQAGVSPYPLRWIETHRKVGETRSAAQVLLASEGFCGELPAQKNGFPRCGKDDHQKIGLAQDTIAKLLTDKDHYSVPQRINSTAALYSGSEPIMCRFSAPGRFVDTKPADRPAPFDAKTIPFRIRGSADSLQFDRSDGAFNGVEKATISFKDDDAGGKDTTKATIVAGIVVPIADNMQIVPYLGWETDTSKKVGEDKQVTSNILRAGALLDFRTHDSRKADLFLIRPEYATSRKDRSKIFTGTFIYQPIRNNLLNTAIVFAPGDQKLLSLILRLDGRIVSGDFIKRGDRLPEGSRDFVRVGTQFGFTITSDVRWLPFELNVTETYLRALQGEPDNLSYLRSVFSVYFDEKKYFGVDLGYARGRKDDLAVRERNWTIGFGAKF